MSVIAFSDFFESFQQIIKPEGGLGDPRFVVGVRSEGGLGTAP